MSQGKFFLIQSHMNDMCLDVLEGNMAAGTPVCTWEVNGASHQLWYMDSVRGVIRNKADDNFVMEVQGDQLVINEYNPDEPNQKFDIDGQVLRCQGCPDQAVDIADNNCDPGATVCSYEYHEGDNQHWSFNHMEPEYCYIRSEANDKVMDIKGGDDDEEARVILFKQNEEQTDNQIFYEDRNGFIRSKMTDFAFDTFDEDKLRVREFDADVSTQRWVKCGNKIVHKDEPDRCLEVKEGGFMKKDKVEVGDFTGDVEQRWNFEYVY